MITPLRLTPVFSALSPAAKHAAGGVRTLGVASLLLLGAASVQAADFYSDEDFSSIARPGYDVKGVNDWRLGFTMLPASADLTIMAVGNDANSANYRRETNWDLTGRTGLMWMTPLSNIAEDGDFILGLELSTNHCVIERDNSSPEIDLRTYQLTIHPGLAWALDDGFHLEVNPYFGVGFAEFEQSAAGDGTGTYWEVGLRSGIYYTWRNNMQFGVQVGYIYAIGSGEIDGTETFDTEMIISGLTLGLQVGYRL